MRGVGGLRDTWTAAHAGLETVNHVIDELVAADEIVAVGARAPCGDHESDMFEIQAFLP